MHNARELTYVSSFTLIRGRKQRGGAGELIALYAQPGKQSPPINMQFFHVVVWHFVATK